MYNGGLFILVMHSVMDSTPIMTILFLTDSEIGFFLSVSKRISRFQMFCIQRIGADFYYPQTNHLHYSIEAHILFEKIHVQIRSLRHRKRATQALKLKVRAVPLPAAFTPKRYSCYSFLLEAEST
jgi:hypothetical protein